jgi:hypothetical protein
MTALGYAETRVIATAMETVNVPNRKTMVGNSAMLPIVNGYFSGFSSCSISEAFIARSSLSSLINFFIKEVFVH